MAALGLVLAALVVLGVPVWWLAETYRQPSSTPAPSDAERIARLRHERARDEIRTIQTATMRLMRAVAASSSELSRGTLGVRPEVRPTPGLPVPGLSWTPGPVASSTSSPGRLTFSTTTTQRG